MLATAGDWASPEMVSISTRGGDMYTLWVRQRKHGSDDVREIELTGNALLLIASAVLQAAELRKGGSRC